ncbi:VWA domain-containing protein [Flavobacteriaceae bacterium GSB9]|nr:VWA domain-containing protein [Flavobacteriaceae bacterium GSB9]
MFKWSMLFAFLRFLTVFSVLLLLINPMFDKVSSFVEKPNLVVAIDNSKSIKHLKQNRQAEDFIAGLEQDKALNEKFNLELYTFGETLKKVDSVTFSESQTNINQVFTQLNQIYKQTNSPTVLVTDGNQTFGADYTFANRQYKQPIFPIILGDTVSYTDLKIQQLNVNKYAYHKNKFPVEAILVYNGNAPVKTNFVITRGNTTVYSEEIDFSKSKNSKVLNLTLPANITGTGSYRAVLRPLDEEKNKVNNTKNFIVEVINQKTKIAIVSDIWHPDLGALKKSVESNEQRSVIIVNSKNILSEIEDYELFILYQPNNKFNDLWKRLDVLKKNRFTIVAPKTDLDFLNRIQSNYTIEISNQPENYQAELNRNYTPFLVQDINFESFPPLLSNYGSTKFSVPIETILNKSLNGVSVQEPLLATFELNNTRHAVLFGEGIWQWRASSFLNSKSFAEFDTFLGKLIQYLASNKSKSRLNVDYESIYNGSNNVIVKAEFFDKNYVFDAREKLNITVTDKASDASKTYPMVLKNNNYQVDLSSLPASSYKFTVRATKENLAKSGSFQILEYNVEQQFLNANVNKLNQLAKNSSGRVYFIANTKNLVTDLINDNRFVPVQKSVKKSISLIDWKYLLAIITISLGLEWFLRKYNGLI